MYGKQRAAKDDGMSVMKTVILVFYSGNHLSMRFHVILTLWGSTSLSHNMLTWHIELFNASIQK